MHLRPALPLAASLLLLSTPLLAAVHPHHRTSAHPIVRRTASTHLAHPTRLTEHASASAMSPERATEIQTALIQKGYLSGEPSGTWDASAIAAMQKVQADNGWQTKYVPDSRALIKLGLGAGSKADTLTPPATAATTPIEGASPLL